MHKRVFEKADRQMQVIESENLTFSHSDGENWGDLYASLDI